MAGLADLSGLVSYWNLDETGNNNRIDSHGANDLAPFNTMASLVDADFGVVADFSGSAGLWISDAAQAGLDITGDITINYYVSSDVLANAYPLTKWYHAQRNQYLTQFYANGASGYIGCLTDSSCSGYGYVGASRPATINANEWHMFTFRRVGTTGTLFLNGVQLGATFTVETSADCTADFSLGFEKGRNVAYLNGQMSRVGIWSRGLTDDEVLTLTGAGQGLLYSELLTGVGSGASYQKMNKGILM